MKKPDDLHMKLCKYYGNTYGENAVVVTLMLYLFHNQTLAESLNEKHKIESVLKLLKNQ